MKTKLFLLLPFLIFTASTYAQRVEQEDGPNQNQACGTRL
jgi:hypothetical protein